MGKHRSKTGRRPVLQLNEDRQAPRNPLRGMVSYPESEDEDSPSGVTDEGSGSVTPAENDVSSEPTKKIDLEVADFLKEIDALTKTESNDASEMEEEPTTSDGKQSGETETQEEHPIQETPSGDNPPQENGIGDSVMGENQDVPHTSQMAHTEQFAVSYPSGSLWHQCYDENSGYSYYWNTQTNEVTWVCPPEYANYIAALEAAGFLANEGTVVSSSDTYPQKPPTAKEKKKKKKEKKISEEGKVIPITSFGPPSSDSSSEESESKPSVTRNKKKKPIRKHYGPELPKSEAPSVAVIGPQLPSNFLVAKPEINSESPVDVLDQTCNVQAVCGPELVENNVSGVLKEYQKEPTDKNAENNKIVLKKKVKTNKKSKKLVVHGPNLPENTFFNNTEPKNVNNSYNKPDNESETSLGTFIEKGQEIKKSANTLTTKSNENDTANLHETKTLLATQEASYVPDSQENHSKLIFPSATYLAVEEGDIASSSWTLPKVEFKTTEDTYEPDSTTKVTSKDPVKKTLTKINHMHQALKPIVQYGGSDSESEPEEGTLAPAVDSGGFNLAQSGRLGFGFKEPEFPVDNNIVAYKDENNDYDEAQSQSNFQMISFVKSDEVLDFSKLTQKPESIISTENSETNELIEEPESSKVTVKVKSTKLTEKPEPNKTTEQRELSELNGSSNLKCEVTEAQTKPSETTMDIDVDEIDRALERAFEEQMLANAEEMEASTSGRLKRSASEEPETVSKMMKSDQPDSSETSRDTWKDIPDLIQVLLDKLAFLDPTRSCVSSLTHVLIQLETRYKDWQEGVLQSSYFTERLLEVNNYLQQYEMSVMPPGWICSWDRNHKRYFYANQETGFSQWDFPVITASPKGNLSQDKDNLSVIHSTKSTTFPSQPSQSTQNPSVSSSISRNKPARTLVSESYVDLEPACSVPIASSVAESSLSVTESSEPSEIVVESSQSTIVTQPSSQPFTTVLPTMKSSYSTFLTTSHSTSEQSASVVAFVSHLLSDSPPPPPGVESPPPPPGVDSPPPLPKTPPPPPPDSTELEEGEIPEVEMDVEVVGDGDNPSSTCTSFSVLAPPPPPPPLLSKKNYSSTTSASSSLAQNQDQSYVIAKPPQPPSASSYVTSSSTTNVFQPLPSALSFEENYFIRSEPSPISGPSTSAETPPIAPVCSSSNQEPQSSSTSKKDKKKPKLSSGLSLKKKNIPSLVQKWEKIKKQQQRENKEKSDSDQKVSTTMNQP
ncbi:formin-binding protein 4-like [Limulus polyphemus]|uniref:Formin-binding protein 4-like n=1 Tax=Limulus polyphemus TaxID=6850 RepID=A0ABM1BSS6_LIMPO|nr:formin-binding protein 4-like [Limulus polyphemus]